MQGTSSQYTADPSLVEAFQRLSEDSLNELEVALLVAAKQVTCAQGDMAMRAQAVAGDCADDKREPTFLHRADGSAGGPSKSSNRLPCPRTVPGEHGGRRRSTRLPCRTNSHWNWK